MLVICSMLVLLAAMKTSAHELGTNFSPWNIPQKIILNDTEMTSDIIYLKAVPMSSNGRREQNDAIAGVYGPAFLRVEWIWDGFGSKNIKYNPHYAENEEYQNLDKNHNRDGVRDIYLHEIEPIRNQNYNFEHGRNGNPEVKYNLDSSQIQSELYIHKREPSPKRRNWESQETQGTERIHVNTRENIDDSKHENKKAIFPRLHKLRIDAKHILEGLVSKIRALLPQLKHLEDKDIIKLLRWLDLDGLGQKTKERIKQLREQLHRFDTESDIERKPKQGSIKTVGNRLYPGYDDPSYPQRIRLDGVQNEEEGDYRKGSKETPHGWEGEYQPAWARLPEVSFQGRYHGMD